MPLLKEMVVGLVVVLFSAWYYWQAGFLPERSADPLGPAALPRMLAVAMIFFAVAHMAVSYFRRERLAEEEEPDELSGPARVKGNFRIAGIVVLTLMYAVTMDTLGYTVSTLLYLLLFMVLVGVRTVPSLVLSSLGITASLVWLFAKFLGVLVPQGFIEQIILH